MRLTIISLVVVATLMVSCGRGFRVIDTDPKLQTGDATVTGIVTGSGDRGVPLANRTVICVNSSTGQRYTAVTNSAGGYTLKLPAGTYNLDMELRAGESLSKRPERVVALEVGEIETRMDFQLQPATR